MKRFDHQMGESKGRIETLKAAFADMFDRYHGAGKNRPQRTRHHKKRAIHRAMQQASRKANREKTW
jgi:hypothetical protein